MNTIKNKITKMMILLILFHHVTTHNKPIKEELIPICSPITSENDLRRILPLHKEQLLSWVQILKETNNKLIKTIVTIPPPQRTFSNTMRALDIIIGKLNSFYNLCFLLSMVTTSQELKETCNTILATTYEDPYQIQDLYNACTEYVQHQYRNEPLLEEEQDFVSTTMKYFKHAGHSLQNSFWPFSHPRKKLQELTAKVSHQQAPSPLKELTQTMLFSLDDLLGVRPSLVAKLPVKKDFYELRLNPLCTSDLHTYNEIMETCSIPQTRKKLYQAMNQKTVTQVEEELTAFINHQNNRAQILGYNNFPELVLTNTMAQSTLQAHLFLNNTIKKCVHEGLKELQQIKQNLPSDMTCENGTLAPWDYPYARRSFLEKQGLPNYFHIEQHLSLDHVISEMFALFGALFALSFTPIKHIQTWHQSVRVIAVEDNRTNTCIGYLYFDLLQRPQKQSGPCCIPLTMFPRSEQHHRPINVIIANFNDSSLTLSNVETLFHEFGHALHGLLAQTTMASHHALVTTPDILEFPSQLFEEWVYNEAVLRRYTRHHTTQKPLDTITIKKIREYRFRTSWKQTLTSCIRALFSLTVFTCDTNTQNFWQTIQDHLIPDTCLHLPLMWYYQTLSSVYDPGYGPKQYGYAWSQCYAKQAFALIEQAGISNPKIGKSLRDTIFSKASGTADQNLLRNFFLAIVLDTSA